MGASTDPYELRILVTGGRDFNDKNCVFSWLDWTYRNYHSLDPVVKLIHGGARGADSLAGEWARNNNIQEVCVPADWCKHGKSAGLIRNGIMVNMRPHVCVAFPGGRGTANCIGRCREAGIKIVFAN